MSKQAVPEADTRDARERRSREGQAAIRRLGAPVRARLRAGQVLVLVSAVLAVAPYVALVRLGGVLLDAYNAGAADQIGRASCRERV